MRLFAGLRERAGGGRRELELPEGSTIASVWPALALGSEPAGLAYAVNREYAEPTAPLADGDEVAVIPPVSGGAPRISLTAAPLDLAAVVAAVAGPDAGAIATFLGTVRNQTRGTEVLYLDYEAFDEMAEHEMERIAAHVCAAHGCLRAAIWHRTGRVELGEPSVAVAVAAAHRASALAACAEAIDTLKLTVPIWKKEHTADGGVWIGRGA